jgi:hypothetical protein
MNAQRRQTGSECMVLQRDRCPEHGHDAVAGELVYRAPVPLDNGGAAGDQLGHDFAQTLCTHRRSHVHRMHDVGEQDGYLLVLRTGVLLGDRCTAAVKESRTRPRLGATRAARGRCGHPTLRRFRPPNVSRVL